MTKFTENMYLRECALTVHSLLLEGYQIVIKPTSVCSWSYYCKLKHSRNGNVVYVKGNEFFFEIVKNGKVIKQLPADN